MARILAADKVAIAALVLPPWVDRDKDVKVVIDPETEERTYTVTAELPAFLRRPETKNISTDTRVRWIEKGKWVSIRDGKGRHFYRVTKAGTLRVKYRNVKGREVCCTGGTAILFHDSVMERNMNPANWRAKE